MVALTISISARASRRAQLGFRYVMCRSSLRSAVLLAVNSYIRFAWNTPRAFSIAGSCWAQTGLSVKSHILAVFATIPILRENFAVGLGTRQAPTPEETGYGANPTSRKLPHSTKYHLRTNVPCSNQS